MIMAIYVTKLIFNKYHLENITLTIAKKNMIVTCSTEDQKTCHAYRHMNLSSLCHTTDFHFFHSIRMTSRGICYFPIYRTQFLQSAQKGDKEVGIIMTIHITISPKLRKSKNNVFL